MGHIERDLKEYPVASVNKETLVKEFSSFLPTESVKHETEDLTPFECDGLTAYPQIPLIAVLPENEEQVCQVMKVCNQFKVPIVFRGAGTGLSGGAIPYDQGVLLVLTKRPTRREKRGDIGSNEKIQPLLCS
jgi:glycolate oxidase